jgi:hypothetical protein
MPELFGRTVQDVKPKLERTEPITHQKHLRRRTFSTGRRIKKLKIFLTDGSTINSARSFHTDSRPAELRPSFWKLLLAINLTLRSKGGESYACGADEFAPSAIAS